MRALVLAVVLAGCGGVIGKDTQIATQSAIATATDPDSQKRLDALAAGAGAAARDALLDEETTHRVQALTQVLGQTLEAELATGSAMVREQLRQEVAELATQLRQLVRQAIDEALSQTTLTELDAVREHVVGEQLRQDLTAAVDTAIDEAAARAGAKVAPLQAQAAADGHYALIAAGALALLVIALAVLAHQHRRRIATLEARLGRLEVS